MILSCPECATRYFVDDSKVGPDGRTVKCANCGARWTARVQDALELGLDGEGAASSVDEKADPPLVSELPGEELPKVFRAKALTEAKVREAAATGVVWAGMAAALVAILALAAVFRMDMVRLWPRSAAAYARVGLGVNPTGLTIENVRAEPALQDGHAALSVFGEVRNVQDHAAVVPPLRVSLLNPAGKRIAGKIAVAQDPSIPPGETRHFAITLLDPPATASDLEITFALEPGVDKAVRQATHKAEPKAEAHLNLRGPAAVEPGEAVHAAASAADTTHDAIPMAQPEPGGHEAPPHE